MSKKAVSKKKKQAVISKKAVSSKKILILTASPARDKVVDDLIAEKLRSMGYDVWVRPCLRQGRAAILELEPNVVVVPPVRNPHSRDLVEIIKEWGMGVVSRHTEASCDWQDFKGLDATQKTTILGSHTYKVDVEIVWGQDEAEILSRRNCGFPVKAVGSFAIDIYLQSDARGKFLSREVFNEKYKFDSKKKTLHIGSPWGFADSAPDLQIDEIREVWNEVDKRDKYIEMIKQVHKALSKDWNILLAPHPGVLLEPYKEALKGLNIPVGTELTATERLFNVDALIHSGSTMAVEAHFVGIPAYQYGDVNQKKKNWWLQPKSLISQVSKIYEDVEKMIKDIGSWRGGSNANTETIKKLEAGRYGKMDGKATERAAEIISKINGRFKQTWPKAWRDYDQPIIFKHIDKAIDYSYCGICGNKFPIVKKQWLEMILSTLDIKSSPDKLKRLSFDSCPWCASRFYHD